MIQILESSVVLKMTVVECSDLYKAIVELKPEAFRDLDGNPNMIQELTDVLLKVLAEE